MFHQLNIHLEKMMASNKHILGKSLSGSMSNFRHSVKIWFSTPWVDWGVDDAPDLEQVNDGLEITFCSEFNLEATPEYHMFMHCICI